MDLDLGPAADQMAAIVDNIGEEQLADPTPCDRTNVADMLTHVHGLSIAFRDAAVKNIGPTTSAPPAADGARLPGDWRYSIRTQLAELAEAWRAPEAWQGETMAGGLTMPAEVTGLVANNELVLHAWDLARRPASRMRLPPGTWRRPGSRCQHPRRPRGPRGPVRAAPADRRRRSPARQDPRLRRKGPLGWPDCSRSAVRSSSCLTRAPARRKASRPALSSEAGARTALPTRAIHAGASPGLHHPQTWVSRKSSLASRSAV